MSKLIIHEYPIMILPSLAMKIGLMEAVILQQIHYWLLSSSHHKEGRKWVYNTYKQWQQQLPFWSESTIKRTIKSLEKQEYLLSANFNRHKMDKTKWYSIHYEKLQELDGSGQELSKCSTDHMGPFDHSNSSNQETSVTQAIPETTPETSTKTTTNEIPFTDIITYLNKKTHSFFRPGTTKTKGLITSRWNEGFRLADFQKVIDLKTEEWLQDPHWNKYLRPETLFGPKFESYLNQKIANKSYSEGDFNLDD